MFKNTASNTSVLISDHVTEELSSKLKESNITHLGHIAMVTEEQLCDWRFSSDERNELRELALKHGVLMESLSEVRSMHVFQRAHEGLSWLNLPETHELEKLLHTQLGDKSIKFLAHLGSDKSGKKSSSTDPTTRTDQRYHQFRGHRGITE